MVFRKLPLPCLMLVTAPMESRRLVDVVSAAVSGGVNAVQLRDKSLSDCELIELAEDFKSRLGSTPVIINGSASAAVSSGAAGVQLPELGTFLDTAREIVGMESLIGCSVHSLDSAARAKQQGADYVIAGTVFRSGSHPSEASAGVAFLETVCAAVSIPVLAIGGVTAANCAECIAAGASGVAVISSVLNAADPGAAAREIWDRMNEAAGEVVINGERRSLVGPLSILQLLAQHRLKPQMVVVEHNGVIVSRDRYSDVQLQNGDEVEIVQMMAGG